MLQIEPLAAPPLLTPTSTLLPVLDEQHMMCSQLRLISPSTLNDVLNGVYDAALSDGYTVVDCRFPYEFQAGHVRGAENLWTFEAVFNRFFTSLAPTFATKQNHAIIFHCEFSSSRAPTQCKNLRYNIA